MKYNQGDILQISQIRDYVTGSRKVTWHVVLININTNKDIYVSTDINGLTGFYGFWYGNNPLSRNSFGKIEGHISDIISCKEYAQSVYKVGNAGNFELATLKRLLQ